MERCGCSKENDGCRVMMLLTESGRCISNNGRDESCPVALWGQGNLKTEKVVGYLKEGIRRLLEED